MREQDRSGGRVPPLFLPFCTRGRENKCSYSRNNKKKTDSCENDIYIGHHRRSSSSLRARIKLTVQQNSTERILNISTQRFILSNPAIIGDSTRRTNKPWPALSK